MSLVNAVCLWTGRIWWAGFAFLALVLGRREIRWRRQQPAEQVIDDVLPQVFTHLPPVPYGTVADEAERITREAAGD